MQDSPKGSETSETSAVSALPEHKNSHEKWRLSYCVNCFCSYRKQQQMDIKEHDKKQFLKKKWLPIYFVLFWQYWRFYRKMCLFILKLMIYLCRWWTISRNLEENLNRSNFSWLEQLAKIVFLINAFSHRESWHLVQCLNSQLSRLESVAMPEFCLRNFISGEIAHLSVQYKCKLS